MTRPGRLAAFRNSDSVNSMRMMMSRPSMMKLFTQVPIVTMSSICRWMTRSSQTWALMARSSCPCPPISTLAQIHYVKSLARRCSSKGRLHLKVCVKMNASREPTGRISWWSTRRQMKSSAQLTISGESRALRLRIWTRILRHSRLRLRVTARSLSSTCMTRSACRLQRLQTRLLSLSIRTKVGQMAGSRRMVDARELMRQARTGIWEQKMASCAQLI